MPEDLKEYRWGDFKDWADDNGVSLRDIQDWEPWWECWKAAIDAYKLTNMRDS